MKCVYFAQAGNDGPIKIGTTSGDPARRIAGLQTGCPHRIKLLAVVTGDESHERLLHDHFRQHRLEGEWFHPAPALLLATEQIVLGTFEWPAPRSIPPYIEEGRLLGDLMAVARTYCAASNLSLATVSTRIFNDGKVFKRIEQGADLYTRRYEQAMKWFVDRWPSAVDWPLGSEPPEVIRSEDIAA